MMLKFLPAVRNSGMRMQVRSNLARLDTRFVRIVEERTSHPNGLASEISEGSRSTELVEVNIHVCVYQETIFLSLVWGRFRGTALHSASIATGVVMGYDEDGWPEPVEVDYGIKFHK
jgi:hypothetical protein